MQIERLGPVFGAEIQGYELSPTMPDADLAAIEAALAEHEVLVFRDQDLSAEAQLALGRRFGELVISPFSPNADAAPELIVLDYHPDRPAPLTDIWHADETYRPEPPRMTMLKALVVPELGGDTMFASMRAAYEGLSDRMRALVEGLTAHHGFGRFNRLAGTSPEALRRLHEVELRIPHPDHPVVAVHPVTGRRILYVNRHFTERINELPDDEGRAILDFLLTRTNTPEVQLRVTWRVGTVTMWDNRSVQHYAPYDYYPQRRRMERVTVAGSAPIAAGPAAEVRVDHVEVHGVARADVAEHEAAPTREFERA